MNKKSNFKTHAHVLEFSIRITEACFNSKSDFELFGEGRNLLQEVIKDAYQRLIPLGNHRLRIKSKIEELRDIGFLDEDYANNCKQIYDEPKACGCQQWLCS